MSVSSPFRALKSPNYRLFFIGQTVSLFGNWMTQTATLWLIYQLTSSAFMVGLLTFVSQIPSFLLGPIAGWWVDRTDRHRLLIVTQILSMLQSFALAGFAFAGQIDVAHLLVLGGLQGFINAFEMTARQSLVVDFLEDRSLLGNAIALNSSMFNVARLGGPALAGFVIAWGGAAFCYLVDGLSFLAVLVCLFLMRLPHPQEPPKKSGAWEGLRDGLLYTWAHPLIRPVLLLVTAICFFAFSFSSLVPGFARDVFHGDARTLGLMMSSSGLGSLTAALYLSTRTGTKGLGAVIVFGGTVLSCALIALPFAPVLWLAVPCLYCVGLGGVLLVASSNTIIQTLVDDRMRGRVIALFTMAFTGTAPVSNLIMGWAAQRTGNAVALGAAGAVSLLSVVLFHRARPRIRAAMARARAVEPVPLLGGKIEA
ncbi:MAG: MFS transporter [Verrucomicrobia bacterium]|nr:MFS transporter [Verrucomicrobiota bacterium]